MSVRVDYTGQLRSAAGFAGIELEFSAAATLGDLFTRLVSEGPPALRSHLVTADGRVQPTLVVVVDGQAVAGAEREATVLPEGATVVLLPPVAGG